MAFGFLLSIVFAVAFFCIGILQLILGLTCRNWKRGLSGLGLMVLALLSFAAPYLYILNQLNLT